MTSKEALERLYDGYQNGMAGRSFYDIIKQELDRLEKLENSLKKYEIKDLSELEIALDQYYHRYDKVETRRVDGNE